MATNTSKQVVLTIDDDPVILNSVYEVLRHEYVVRPFSSGEDALAYLRENAADLILLDHNMPTMTGLELLRILQNNPKTEDIPVIFLTGSNDGADEVSALEIGAMDYLLKPFKPSSLLTRVRLQLELQNHRNHLEELVDQRTAELVALNVKLKNRDKITLDLLAIASDMRDHETGTHMECVVLFTRAIVQYLLEHPFGDYAITDQYGEDIIDSVILHDLGKIGMPDGILLKNDKLTEEEMKVIKTHPQLGSQMLQHAIDKLGDDSLLFTANEIALGHHEKWDGSGYPYGVCGTSIPLSARIATVVDVFDALTSPRPYKEAWPTEKAFEFVYENAGRHFDPYLVEVVKQLEKEFEEVVVEKKTFTSKNIFNFFA